MTINTGGPAVPVDPEITPDRKQEAAWCGMTLRDYFAAKYLAGYTANPICFPTREDAAREAYLMADAMLKAREGEK